MYYYKVNAKCGHVGRNKYILKWFFVKAETGEDAASTVRFMPRVKHNHKDAIREVIKIDYDEYINGIKIMTADMYFNVHNSTDQRLLNCISQDELYPEIEQVKYKKKQTGQRIRFELLERETKRQLQGGVSYDG